MTCLDQRKLQKITNHTKTLPQSPWWQEQTHHYLMCIIVEFLFRLGGEACGLYWEPQQHRWWERQGKNVFFFWHFDKAISQTCPTIAHHSLVVPCRITAVFIGKVTVKKHWLRETALLHFCSVLRLSTSNGEATSRKFTNRKSPNSD